MRTAATFPNVLVTGDQALFAADALEHTAPTTIASQDVFERGEPLEAAAPPPE